MVVHNRLNKRARRKMTKETEDIGINPTYCENCKKDTLSKLSEDKTHYFCEECKGIK